MKENIGVSFLSFDFDTFDGGSLVLVFVVFSNHVRSARKGNVFKVAVILFSRKGLPWT